LYFRMACTPTPSSLSRTFPKPAIRILGLLRLGSMGIQMFLMGRGAIHSGLASADPSFAAGMAYGKDLGPLGWPHNMNGTGETGVE